MSGTPSGRRRFEPQAKKKQARHSQGANHSFWPEQADNEFYAYLTSSALPTTDIRGTDGQQLAPEDIAQISAVWGARERRRKARVQFEAEAAQADSLQANSSQADSLQADSISPKRDPDRESSSSERSAQTPVKAPVLAPQQAQTKDGGTAVFTATAFTVSAGALTTAGVVAGVLLVGIVAGVVIFKILDAPNQSGGGEIIAQFPLDQMPLTEAETEAWIQTTAQTQLQQRFGEITLEDTKGIAAALNAQRGVIQLPEGATLPPAAEMLIEAARDAAAVPTLGSIARADSAASAGAAPVGRSPASGSAPGEIITYDPSTANAANDSNGLGLPNPADIITYGRADSSPLPTPAPSARHNSALPDSEPSGSRPFRSASGAGRAANEGAPPATMQSEAMLAAAVERVNGSPELAGYREPSVIAALQAALGIPVTGQYDISTARFILSFQQLNGLLPDGLLGGQMFEAIMDQSLSDWQAGQGRPLETITVEPTESGGLGDPNAASHPRNQVHEEPLPTHTGTPPLPEAERPQNPEGIPLNGEVGETILTTPNNEQVPGDPTHTPPFPPIREELVPLTEEEIARRREAEAAVQNDLATAQVEDDFANIALNGLSQGDADRVVHAFDWDDVRVRFRSQPAILSSLVDYRELRLRGSDGQGGFLGEARQALNDQIAFVDSGTNAGASDRDIAVVSRVEGDVSLETAAVIEINQAVRDAFGREAGEVFDVNVYTTGHMPKNAFGTQAEEFLALTEVQQYLDLTDRVRRDESELRSLEETVGYESMPYYQSLQADIASMRATLGDTEAINATLKKINAMRAQEGASDNFLPEDIGLIEKTYLVLEIQKLSETLGKALSQEAEFNRVSTPARAQLNADQMVYANLQQRRNMTSDEWATYRQNSTATLGNTPVESGLRQQQRQTAASNLANSFELTDQIYTALENELSAEAASIRQQNPGMSEAAAINKARVHLYEYYLLRTQPVRNELNELRMRRAEVSAAGGAGQTLSNDIDGLTLQLYDLHSRALYFAKDAYHTGAAATATILKRQQGQPVSLTSQEWLIAFNDDIGFSLQQAQSSAGADAEIAFGQAVWNSSKYLYRAVQDLEGMSEVVGAEMVQSITFLQPSEIARMKNLFSQLEDIKRKRKNAYGLSETERVNMARDILVGTEFYAESIEGLRARILEFSERVNAQIRSAFPVEYDAVPSVTPEASDGTSSSYDELLEELRSRDLGDADVLAIQDREVAEWG